MAKEERTSTVVKRFKKAGWTKERTVGSHSIWRCPSGKHTFVLPDGHRMISPGGDAQR